MQTDLFDWLEQQLATNVTITSNLVLSLCTPCFQIVIKIVLELEVMDG